MGSATSICITSVVCSISTCIIVFVYQTVTNSTFYSTNASFSKLKNLYHFVTNIKFSSKPCSISSIELTTF